MIRKQLYLDESQDRALKQRAKELGIAEAEVVRRALDAALFGDARQAERRRALREFFDRADALSASHRPPEGYRFNRQELYEEDRRFTRWGEE